VEGIVLPCEAVPLYFPLHSCRRGDAALLDVRSPAQRETLRKLVGAGRLSLHKSEDPQAEVDCS